MIRTKRTAKHEAPAATSAPTPLRDDELGAVSGADKKPKPADPTPKESISFAYGSLQVTYSP